LFSYERQYVEIELQLRRRDGGKKLRFVPRANHSSRYTRLRKHPSKGGGRRF
jgi:hypothetical protein